MSDLVEVVEMPGNPDAAEKAITEAVTASRAADKVPDKSAAVVRPTQAAPVEEGLPEKFRGKSAKDIAEAYLNLESQYGRMANDLGVQRKLTDRLLDLKRDDDLRRNSAPAVKVESTDLLERPTETLERFVEAREKARDEQLSERLARLEGSLAEQRFMSNHRDFQQITGSTEFQSWVRQSPLRMRAAAAAYSGDWTVADDLLTEYKANNRTDTSRHSSVANEALEAARKAGLETNSVAGTDGDSKGAGKIIKRSDLMMLRITKPDLYYSDEFQSEVIRAYADGRVK